MTTPPTETVTALTPNDPGWTWRHRLVRRALLAEQGFVTGCAFALLMLLSPINPWRWLTVVEEVTGKDLHTPPEP